jgi:hypothetical protein
MTRAMPMPSKAWTEVKQVAIRATQAKMKVRGCIEAIVSWRSPENEGLISKKLTGR